MYANGVGKCGSRGVCGRSFRGGVMSGQVKMGYSDGWIDGIFWAREEQEARFYGQANIQKGVPIFGRVKADQMRNTFVIID
jgi:hypothetical protein